MTIFFRVLEADDKASTLMESIHDEVSEIRFQISPEAFGMIPGSPFSYWVSDRIRGLFEQCPPFASDKRDAAVGASTKDDFRYVRLWTEISPENVAVSRMTTEHRKWVPFAKGGTFSPYYADPHLVINWYQDGRELKADITEYRGSRGWGYQWSAALNGHSDYFRPGLTWPRRTQSGLGIRLLPSGCIFADKGPACFVEGDGHQEILCLLGITTSASFKYLVEMQMAFGSYEVGVIQRTPIPLIPQARQDELSRLAKRAWSIKRKFDTTNEVSHAFLVPASLREKGRELILRDLETELENIQANIDDICFRLYGIYGEERANILQWATRKKADIRPPIERLDPHKEDDEEKTETDERTRFLSWVVGIIFGRFDIRLATGERQAPPDPDSFDPLPVLSPGMVREGEQPFHSNAGVYVDDPGHRDDLTAAAQVVLREIKADRQQVEPENIRFWLAREFFAFHIKMYSKSKRKAPIYWQLATPSGSYSVWLYIHAFTRDTLYQVQNDYIAPKLLHEERRLEELRREAGPSPSAAARKQVAAQEAFVAELGSFLEEVRRVAPLWDPDLDDGVIINFAPLWRLVPQHKAWQRELKSVWDDLCTGKYDWAHLAMHLWPERVLPKCSKDRSLAIAHGLEDRFWVQGDDGKHIPRMVSPKEQADMVRERTAPAVKAAMESLLTANGSLASASRPRRRS